MPSCDASETVRDTADWRGCLRNLCDLFPAEKPDIVEWVYKTKWGHAEEIFDIFKKYQIRVLDRQKELGDAVQYTVYRPGLHTGEDERWYYRVVIVYRNQQAPSGAREVERQLFSDHETPKGDENRRWELIDAHWDLPIREIGPAQCGRLTDRTGTLRIAHRGKAPVIASPYRQSRVRSCRVGYWSLTIILTAH